MKVEKTKEAFHTVKAFDVNDELAKMSAHIDYNTVTGNVKMVFVMTTTHLSFNPSISKMVLQQFGQLSADVYDDALELHRQYLENNRENSSPSLFPDDSDTEAAKDDEGEPNANGPKITVALEAAAEEVTKRKTAVSRRKKIDA